jgi:arsenate reductase (glutaredoxin)
MKTIIYHNPKCSKSREALHLLHEKNQEIEVVEYLKTNLSKEDIQSIVSMLKVSPLEIIRKGEDEFKALKNDSKGMNRTDEEWIELLVQFPRLLERPIVIKGTKAIIGRPPVNVLEII